jgi:hypothetical protein
VIRRAVAASLAVLTTTPALAEDDVQAWGAVTATVPVDDKLVVWLEGQARTSNDVSRLNQVLLRPGLGYRVSPTTTLFVGYAHVFTNPPGPARTNEHRVWQQATFRIAGDGRGLTLSGRSRLEQRSLVQGEDTGVRYRQLLRLTAPVGRQGLQAVGWSELFLGLNRTDWGQPTGFDRARNFAGLSVPLSRTIRAEPGYMYEPIRQRGADRHNHIASVTLNLTL